MTPQVLQTFEVPADLAECQRMIKELIDALKQVMGAVGEKDEQIAELRHRLDVLTRAKFGKSSEVLPAGQMRLFDAPPTVEEESTIAKAAAEAPAVRKHGRRRPAKELPRRRVVHELNAEERACPGCGNERQPIGEEVSERLAYQPACVEVIEEARVKYACRNCQEHVAIAALPAKPIPKGLADASMLAYIATSKFMDHLPLNRLEGIFLRHGAEIHRSTMCDWLAWTADLVLPVYERMKQRVLSSRIIWTDDTPVDMQDRTHEKNIRQARVWVYVGDCKNDLTVYDFTDSRKRDGPATFLGQFNGFLQADAYAGYDQIYASKNVREVACWAHARRKFFDAMNSNKTVSTQALRYIQVLYRIEKRAGGKSFDERLRIRQGRSKRVLALFKKWLDTTILTVRDKEPAGKAIRYALNNWNALCTFIEDGELKADNNKAERALRSLAVGRKNWLFVGSYAGGKRAAILCSLLASCKQHNVNPLDYLTDVLNKLCAGDGDVDLLLPDRWAPVS
jgi:transposase